MLGNSLGEFEGIAVVGIIVGLTVGLIVGGERAESTSTSTDGATEKDPSSVAANVPFMESSKVDSRETSMEGASVATALGEPNDKRESEKLPESRIISVRKGQIHFVLLE